MDSILKIKTVLIILGIVIVVVSAFLLISNAVTNYLLRVALDRKEPKSFEKAKKKIAGSKRMEAVVAAMMEKKQKLEASETEEVQITSYDGKRLIGHFYRNENAKRILIAMHGWRSSWSQDFGLIADFWHDNGCSVLYVEQRGQNNSEGQYMTFGMKERYDCLEWIKWVNANANEDNLPIFLAGVSMGASSVLMATGLELPSNVRGVMADCAFNSAASVFEHVVKDNLHLPYKPRHRRVVRAWKKKINMGTVDYSTTVALANNKIPVLLIHGTEDTLVPVNMTYDNYNACGAEKYLFTVEGASHGMSYFVDKAGYEAAMLDFWNKCA